MATLIILINLVIASLFGGNQVKIVNQGAQYATLTGNLTNSRSKTVTITIQKNNPIILEGDY